MIDDQVLLLSFFGNLLFFFYEYDITIKKRKILRKINYIQRNHDDKRSGRH